MTNSGANLPPYERGDYVKVEFPGEAGMPSVRYVAAAYEISSLSLRCSRGIGFGFDMTSLPDSTVTVYKYTLSSV
jgi:hypothetical protein